MAKRTSYNKAWYAKNRDRVRAQVRGRKATHSAFLSKMKLERGCVDCGFNGHAAALHFDHVRGEKVTDIARMKNYSLENLILEIDKCEVRCANCHAIRTWGGNEN